MRTNSSIRIMKVTIKKLFPLTPTVPFALGQDLVALYPRFGRYARVQASRSLELVGVEDAAEGG